MKQTYLITTAAAALLAGTIFVAAQGTQKQAPGGEGGAQGQTQREPGAQQDQKGKQQGPREQGKQQGTTGQGSDQREPGRQGQQGQSKEKAKTGETQREPGRNQTTGQGQSKERQGQSKENPREGQQGQRDRDGQQGQAREGGSANVTLTTEQRTRIRETVIAKGPRVNNVNFTLNIGVEVPRTVRIVAVDRILVEYYPRFRGYFYFIVGDQIIIVDKGHHIVDVINV